MEVGSSHLRHNAESQHRQPPYHARRGDRLPGFVVEEGFSGAAGSIQGTETSQSGRMERLRGTVEPIADSPRQPPEADHAELAERLAEMPAKEGASVE